MAMLNNQRVDGMWKEHLWLIWGPGSCTLMKPEPEVLIRWNTWQRDFLAAQNQNLSLNMLNSPESQFQHLEIVLPGKMCETHSSSFPEEWWSASHWLSETGPNRGTPSVILTVTRFSLLWDSPNMVSKHNLHIWSYMHTWAHINIYICIYLYTWCFTLSLQRPRMCPQWSPAASPVWWTPRPGGWEKKGPREHVRMGLWGYNRIIIGL